MKKILLLLAMLCGVAYGQVYTPMNQNYEFKRHVKIDSTFNMAQAYADTTAANTAGAGLVAGRMIRIGNDYWMRNTALDAWLQFVNTGSGSTSSDAVWKTDGNYSPSDPSTFKLGHTDSFPLKIYTNNVKRLEVPAAGIDRVSSAIYRYLAYDTTNKSLGYMDAVPLTEDTLLLGRGLAVDSLSPYKSRIYLDSAIYTTAVHGDSTFGMRYNGDSVLLSVAGGGGATPTLQQVLTAGSSLTANNTITSATGNLLTIKTNGVGTTRESKLRLDTLYSDLRYTSSTGDVANVALNASTGAQIGFASGAAGTNFTSTVSTAKAYATDATNVNTLTVHANTDGVEISSDLGAYKMPRTTPTTGDVLTSISGATLGWAAAGGSGWGLTGNTGTTPGTNFIGTTDSVGLVIKTNGVQSGQIEIATQNITLGRYTYPFGSYNTVLGTHAGEGAAGNFNVIVGQNAGVNSNSTGGTYVGQGSGNGASGTYSAFFGGSSGISQSGSYTTGAGQNTLYDNSGDSSTAIGALAGYSNTGARVTLLGMRAGSNANSYRDIIALGYNANATANKQLVISDSISHVYAPGMTGFSTSGYVLTTNGSSATFQAASGGGSVLTGNLAYVDAVNGDDGTAVLGDFTKPYLTPLAAFTAATTGYTIVVRPGVYSLSISSNAMLKDSVNWYFMPGSIFIANAAADGTMFSDNLGAVSCSVTGYGQFYDTLGGISKILEIASSGSNVYFECNSMTVGNGDIDHCIYQADGTLTVNVRGTLESKSYDAISIVGGTLNLTADKIIATGTAEGNAIEITGGNVNIKCREYVSEGDYDAFGSTSAIYWSGGNAYIEGNGVAELSDGLVVASNGTGVLTLRGKLTSTSKTAVVYLSAASGKTLINQATLISNTSFDSIDAPSAQTVVSYGSFANKAVDANITIQGILTIGSYVQ